MKLSIITINYNNLKGLEETFRSVFSQTYKDFEYIVIDGGSSDGSKELIEDNNDRIAFWSSEPDKGIYNAMNKGTQKAHGDFVLYLNSGDTFYQDNVLEQVRHYLKDDVDLVFGDMNYVNNNNGWIKHYTDKIDFDFFVRDTLPHQGTFIRKSFLDYQGIDPYDISLRICSDWKFFVKAIFQDKARVKHIPITIANFQFDGLSSKEESRQIIMSERLNILINDFKTLFTQSFIKLLQDENEYKGLLRSRVVKKYLSIKNKFTKRGR